MRIVNNNLLTSELARIILISGLVGITGHVLLAQRCDNVTINDAQGDSGCVAGCNCVCQKKISPSGPLATCPGDTCQNGCMCTAAQLASLLHGKGFKCDGLVRGVAVALAESYGNDPSLANPDLIDANLNNKNHMVCGTNKSGNNTSYDVGLWQINTGIHPDLEAGSLRPPAVATVDQQANWLKANTDSGDNVDSFRMFKTWTSNTGDSTCTKDLPTACAAAASVQQDFASCGATLCWLSATCGPPCQWPNCAKVTIVTAGDPNDKSGVTGFGSSKWVPGQALTYSVSFSNEPTATAPAQTVTVTDTLNATLVDLSTVALGPINVVNTLLRPNSAPLAAIGTYASALDLRPTTNLIVGISAALNSVTGALTWTFTSLDPATNQPTTDPLAGFLPPGTGGSVSFSALPKQPTATGTQVSNRATVVFDANPPISTPVWTNTIDNSPPTSNVLALPGTEACPNFRVSWSGTDVGSGLQGFTIYYSDNGAPFVPWLANVTAATGTFAGLAGHSYGFYSIAQDLAGNLQPGKTVADTTTQVAAAGSCGPPSLSAQALNIAQSGTTVTANLQLTNTGFTAAQAVSISQLTLRTLSGTGTVTLKSPTLPLAAGSLAIGASTTVPLTFNAPTNVTRFSVTEGGTIKDASGNGYSFSMAQTIIP